MILQKYPSQVVKLGLVYAFFLTALLWSGMSNATAQAPKPPVNKQWNNMETTNFVVMAINAEHRDYLGQTVEFMRRWEYDRWGMKETDFSVKCMILVATDKDEYKKLFDGKEAPTVRIDRDASGKITATSIWCWAEPKFHASVLPRLLTEVCLAEFEQKYGIKFPFWLHRGMGVLNGSLPEIKKEIADISQIYQQNLPCFWSENITTMTLDKLESYQFENKQWFDKHSAVMCLYIMNTHGKKKFIEFIDSSLKGTSSSLPTLGVPGFKELDVELNKFMYIISRDAAAGKASNNSLTWSAK
jgi:hypothetical protein